MQSRRRRRHSAFDEQVNGYSRGYGNDNVDGDDHLDRSRSRLDGGGRVAGDYGGGSTWEVDEVLDLELDLEEGPRKGFNEGGRARMANGNDAWDEDTGIKKGRVPSYALPTKHFKTPRR